MSGLSYQEIETFESFGDINYRGPINIPVAAADVDQLRAARYGKYVDALISYEFPSGAFGTIARTPELRLVMDFLFYS